MPQYPESEKLSAKREHRQVINSFLEWLDEEKGYLLAEWSPPEEGGRDQELFPVYVGFDNLVMEYLGVDTKALEKERRAMLEAQRELNDRG